MANMTAVYLDDETTLILKELKEKNPDFNFSGFVKNALREHQEKIDLSSTDKLELTISKKEEIIKSAMEEAEALKKQHEELIKKEEENKINRIIEQRQKEEFIKKDKDATIKLWRSICKEIYEIDDVTLEVFLEQFYDIPKPRPLIEDFFKSKGYFPKPLE